MNNLLFLAADFSVAFFIFSRERLQHLQNIPDVLIPKNGHDHDLYLHKNFNIMMTFTYLKHQLLM